MFVFVAGCNNGGVNKNKRSEVDYIRKVQSLLAFGKFERSKSKDLNGYIVSPELPKRLFNHSIPIGPDVYYFSTIGRRSINSGFITADTVSLKSLFIKETEESFFAICLDGICFPGSKGEPGVYSKNKIKEFHRLLN